MVSMADCSVVLVLVLAGRPSTALSSKSLLEVSDAMAELTFDVNANCWLTCDAESVYTSAKGEHLKDKLLPEAKAWLESAGP